MEAAGADPSRLRSCHPGTRGRDRRVARLRRPLSARGGGKAVGQDLELLALSTGAPDGPKGRAAGQSIGLDRLTRRRRNRLDEGQPVRLAVLWKEAQPVANDDGGDP